MSSVDKDDGANFPGEMTAMLADGDEATLCGCRSKKDEKGIGGDDFFGNLEEHTAGCSVGFWCPHCIQEYRILLQMRCIV